MRKILGLFLVLLLVAGNAYSAQWRAGTGADSILGSISPSLIDDDSYDDIVAPLDRMFSTYREGCSVEYLSTSTITVKAGVIMLSNATGTIRLMQKNTSDTSVAWTAIDTGSESASETYYVWAYQETVADTDFDICVSLSSATPSGKTYYTKLGSFFNDSSSNILNDETITNENNYYALQLGDWVSKSDDTSYLALTDGFVCAYSIGQASMYAYTDASNPPTTQRVFQGNATGNNGPGITMPVKKGDYWKITATTGTKTVWWIPLNNS